MCTHNNNHDNMKSSARKNPNPNPNPNPKAKLALHYFLRSLARINLTRPLPPLGLRCSRRRIRRAAYASMALAAGPRRAWSRAVLRRLRRRRLPAPPPPVAAATVESREAALRRLVPGGRRMDFCRLLEETGDYIQTLGLQIQLMQRIADYTCQSP